MPPRVLSIVANIIGHATYQRILEETMAARYPEVPFRSLRLTEETSGDLAARVAFSLGTRRLPGCDGEDDRDYYRFRAEMIMSWSAARAVRRRLREGPADVVHFHTRAISLFASWACRGIPFVIDTDTTNAALARFRSHRPSHPFRPLIRREARAYRAATRLVTWSEHARRSMIEDYGEAPEKVADIPPGVPLDFFAQANRGADSEGLPQILFIGNDFVRKGGPDLVEAFLTRLSETAELHLVTHSDHPIPVHGRIHVHRGIRPLSAELLARFAAAEIFTLPTREDTTPMALVEAMGAGLPCVATSCFGIPEVVRDGENGFIIPPGDRAALGERLACLVADADLRRRMGEASRARARLDFNPHTNVGRLVEVLTAAAQGKSIVASPA